MPGCMGSQPTHSPFSADHKECDEQRWQASRPQRRQWWRRRSSVKGRAQSWTVGTGGGERVSGV